jgi:formylglycine-generating enzyme required for sulfatase activity
MMQPSPFLEGKLANAKAGCGMQVVFVDIVSYSKRFTRIQYDVIHAFMNSIEEALLQIEKEFLVDMRSVGVQLRRDVVVLPSGDGAAIAFPFETIPDLHLSFACELLRIANKANKKLDCADFSRQGWCNCCDGFLLRCGISEGKLIPYVDLNGNFNIAGVAINMAARVMDLADPSQIFLTADAYALIVNLVRGAGTKFRKYGQAKIKHDLRIDVYQYIDASREGVDISPRADLDLADDPLESDAPVTPVKLTSELVHSSSSKSRDVELLHAEVPINFVKELRARMVRISNGEFLMGNEQIGRVLVEIAFPFLIDKYTITQEDFVNVMGRNPSKFVGARLPADSITWLDAIMFCNKLSELSNLEPAYDLIGKEATVNFDKSGYRLPTEAEWEYCCRGGGQEDRYGPIEKIAWYSGNSKGKTHEVGQMMANGFGLYDMLGNVWEWCNDWYQRHYPKERQVGYVGPESGRERVVRGGSWSDLPDCIRSSFRNMSSTLSSESRHGMRVVLPYRE